jgi:hypothetical protein
MMRLAFTRNPVESAVPGNLLLRVRAWFARTEAAADASVGDARDASRADSSTGNVTSSNVTSLDGALHKPNTNFQTTIGRTSAVVLPFPLYGEALLVKLADQLRAKIAGSAMAASFDLRVMRQPNSCLAIDGAASVEFRTESSLYLLTIEFVDDTRIKVESSDFDTIVKFVAQYVADRLSADIAGEDKR